MCACVCVCVCARAYMNRPENDDPMREAVVVLFGEFPVCHTWVGRMREEPWLVQPLSHPIGGASCFCATLPAFALRPFV
jgi:hypothetical protein